MALTCGRCGTQNPDGNRFCQSCGTPLVVAAPQPAVPVGATAASPFTQPPPGAQTAYAAAQPPAAYPSPPGYASPPAYASPYYPPGMGAPQPVVHRTPWMIIIAVIVALVVVMGGVGTVLAFALANHNTQQTSGLESVSSPSPAVSPSAGPSPSPSAAPTQTNGNVASNESLAVVIPSGWTVVNKDNETISLESPNGDGAITIGSGASSPPQTAAQNKATMDKFFQQKYPDTKPCPGSAVTNGSVDGASGIFWELCFTLTSGAQSVQVGAPLFVGANADGSVYYAALLETDQSNINQFIAECKPILSGGVTWKLK